MRTAWDLFRDMEDLRREMDRAFRNFGLPRWTSPITRFAFLPGEAARVYPLLNVSEDEHNIYVEALAPGLDTASLKISVVQGQLSISGEKPGLNGGVPREAYHRNERAAGRFVREITLPVEVDQEKATAEYKNGILLVTLPKSEAAKPRQITVKVG